MLSSFLERITDVVAGTKRADFPSLLIVLQGKPEQRFWP